MLSKTRPALASVALAYLAACGGGGGGGGPTTPPPPPAAGFSIDASSAEFVAFTAAAFTDILIQLPLDGIDGVIALHDQAAFQADLSSVDLGCGTGSRIGSLLDSDANGVVSSGDSLSIVFADCFAQYQQKTVTGRFDIDLDEFVVSADGSVHARGSITIPAALDLLTPSGGMAEISGTFDFQVTQTDTDQRLSVSMSAGQSLLTVLLNNPPQRINETITNVSIERRKSNLDIELMTALDLDSELIGGELSCASLTAFRGVLNGTPDSGELGCTAADSSAARLSSAAGRVSIRFDNDGDGQFAAAPSASSSWEDYGEGTFLAGIPRLPNGQLANVIPEIVAVEIPMAVGEVVYNSATGTFFVSNGTDVVEVGLGTGAVLRTLPIPNRPGPLALSDDGSTLWVGLRSATQIAKVPVAAFSVSEFVELGAGCPQFSRRTAESMAVAPGTTDTVVVAMQGNWEVVAYSGGVELPTSLCYQAAPTSIEYRGNAELVGYDRDSGSIQLITLGAGGLSIDKEFPAYGPASSDRFALSSNRVYLNSGRIIDVDTDIVEGRFDHRQFYSSDPLAVLTNASGSVAYSYSTSNDVLAFYDTQTFTALGRYRIPTLGVQPELIDIDGLQLAIATSDGIYLVPTDDLVENAPFGHCPHVDLGGRLGPDFMLQIQCPVNDAVYDASRGVIYVSIASRAGRNGNAVITIDAATGLELSRMHVGSEPTELALSTTGTLLYVVLSESNTVVAVDLATNAVTQRIRVSNDLSFGLVRLPRRVSASTARDDLIVVADLTDAELYSAGAPAMNFADNRERYDSLFLGDFGETAWLVSDREDLIGYQVSSNGLSEVLRFTDVLLNPGVKRVGTRFYDRRGRIFDTATQSAVPGCDLFSVGVETGPSADTAYYLETGFNDRLYTCDIPTRDLDDGFIVPRFGGGIVELRRMFRAGTDRYAIAARGKLVLLDPNEF